MPKILVVDVSVAEQSENRFHREHGKFSVLSMNLLISIENKSDRDFIIRELSFDGYSGRLFPRWRMSLLPMASELRRSMFTLYARERLSISADWPNRNRAGTTENVYLRLRYGGRYTSERHDIALPYFWDRKDG